VPEGGPPFSKVRGLLLHLEALKAQGYKTVGYTESSISMAGWGVAWLAPKVGLKAVIFDPQYKTDCGKPDHLKVLDFHRSKWKQLGAEIRPVPAGMVKVNYNICKSRLEKDYNAIMLPLGLPLKETIRATELIAFKEAQRANYGTVVVCIGSGTICAGLIRGFPASVVINGVMSRSGDVQRKRKEILTKGQIIEDGLLGGIVNFVCIDPGWEYTEKSKIKELFPCHPYYDLKAWEWLVDNVEELEQPVLFWNIGS